MLITVLPLSTKLLVWFVKLNLESRDKLKCLTLAFLCWVGSTLENWFLVLMSSHTWHGFFLFSCVAAMQCCQHLAGFMLSRCSTTEQLFGLRTFAARASEFVWCKFSEILMYQMWRVRMNNQVRSRLSKIKIVPQVLCERHLNRSAWGSTVWRTKSVKV